MLASAALTVVLSGCGESNEANVLNAKGTTKVETSEPPVNSMEDYAKQQQSRPDPYATGGYRGAKKAPAKK